MVSYGLTRGVPVGTGFPGALIMPNSVGRCWIAWTNDVVYRPSSNGQ